MTSWQQSSDLGFFLVANKWLKQAKPAEETQIRLIDELLFIRHNHKTTAEATQRRLIDELPFIRQIHKTSWQQSYMKMALSYLACFIVANKWLEQAKPAEATQKVDWWTAVHQTYSRVNSQLYSLLF